MRTVHIFFEVFFTRRTREIRMNWGTCICCSLYVFSMTLRTMKCSWFTKKLFFHILRADKSVLPATFRPCIRILMASVFPLISSQCTKNRSIVTAGCPYQAATTIQRFGKYFHPYLYHIYKKNQYPKK